VILWPRPVLAIGCLLFTVAGISPAYAQANDEVLVSASMKPRRGGGVVYEYRITNNGKDEIGSVSIGDGGAVNELLEAPLGWTFDDGLPPNSATSPDGWAALVVTMEESEFMNLTWRMESGPGGPTIAPGQTLSGFSVIVPKKDDAYLTGHAYIIFTNSRELTVPLKRTAPTR
jgi:hypothetical protein